MNKKYVYFALFNVFMIGGNEGQESYTLTLDNPIEYTSDIINIEKHPLKYNDRIRAAMLIDWKLLKGVERYG